MESMAGRASTQFLLSRPDSELRVALKLDLLLPRHQGGIMNNKFSSANFNLSVALLLL
jgi:hypothetical protein